jgi:hypothetical protein
MQHDGTLTDPGTRKRARRSARGPKEFGTAQTYRVAYITI